MPKSLSFSLVALFTVAMFLPAMADPAPMPWPEAHSGAYLGVQITAVTPQTASALKLQEPSGAIITYVDQDGPACRAGLIENDVVVAFNGSKIQDPVQLQGLIHTSPAQKAVTLTVVRNGQRKDVKVTLGSWNVMSHARAFDAGGLASPAPPRPFAPDLEVPSFTVLSARHGLVVESLTPQLADFFGVHRGQGVLVRSVEGGSPAAAAGIKAGDVILQVNNEPVHDMNDWQRGMRVGTNGKIWVNLWRDKREQNFVITVSGPGDTSRLLPGEGMDLDSGAQLLGDQVEKLQPEIESSQEDMIAQFDLGKKELEQMRREIETSMKQQQKEIDKMSRKLAASARPAPKEMEALRQEMQRSLPTQKELDEMKQGFQQSIPSEKDLAALQSHALTSMPSQKDLNQLRQNIETSMKNWTPQLQQEMQKVRKQIEQQMLDLQRTMDDSNNRREF